MDTRTRVLHEDGMTKKQFHSKQQKKARKNAHRPSNPQKTAGRVRAQVNMIGASAPISTAAPDGDGDGQPCAGGTDRSSAQPPIVAPVDFDAWNQGAGAGYQATHTAPTEDDLNKRTVDDFIHMGFQYVEWDGRCVDYYSTSAYRLN